MSARALACGADAIGNARSIMIAWWCIRAGLCSGEHWPCPIGMATMEKWKRRWYEQVMVEKIHNIINYIKAHNKWLIQAAAVAGITSPHLFRKEHLAEYKA
jgi:glutamate synthase domain-containing protein 2